MNQTVQKGTLSVSGQDLSDEDTAICLKLLQFGRDDWNDESAREDEIRRLQSRLKFLSDLGRRRVLREESQLERVRTWKEVWQQQLQKIGRLFGGAEPETPEPQGPPQLTLVLADDERE